MNYRLYFSRSVLFLILSIMAVVPVSAQMTGGYSDVPVTNPEVIAAANFAVSAQAGKEHVPGGHQGFKLDEILSAKQQVVAGMNYDLELKVKVHHGKKNARAIVYRNLRDSYQLTSWAWK